ncbi:MAG: type II toxin-antitoxin system RelE/ParE family toxin [Oscillospiraceae bacterium]|jgi:addiction module RelE/StbE family toxin|nr:type II toxin-antitoxin system RelE/ParE family toxin [Oscillospiraceae bacterium]
MGKFDVAFSQQALDDLEEIVLYIALDSKVHALKLHDKILESANKLSDFPMIGRAVPDEKIAGRGFRMIGAGSYLLFYKIFDDKVIILRVLHGRRDYPHLLARIPEEDE